MKNMQEYFGKAMLLVICAAIITSCCVLAPVNASAADFKLSLATYDPAQSANTQYQQQWADKVKKATNGRVEITIYPGGTLCAGPDTLDAVKTGVCDIGWIFTSFYPNQFPLIDVVTLPMMGINSPVQATNALWDLYNGEKAVRNELKDFQMLMLFTNNANLIGTSKKAVKTVADVKGLKLRCPTGAATSMVKAWGGNPIAMGPGDMYQAMQKGVIEGYVFEYAGIGNYALPEITKYYTEMNLFVGPFMLLMNKTKWDTLPADVKKQILSVSGRDTSIGAANCFVKDGEKTRATIMKKDGTIIKLTPDAYKSFKVAADAYNKDWVAAHKIANFNTAAYFKKAVALIKKYGK